MRGKVEGPPTQLDSECNQGKQKLTSRNEDTHFTAQVVDAKLPFAFEGKDQLLETDLLDTHTRTSS
jgi:hypothetical protein